MSTLDLTSHAKSIATYLLVFWDFDGVIKDSVSVKTSAFAQLFSPYGADIAERVSVHHEAHGGMSRFEKIPLYLDWAKVAHTSEMVEDYCQRFAKLARQGVIDAPWVPGVVEFLRGNPFGQEFVLVTATPQNEIEEILAALCLRDCFSQVYGAPMSKQDAIGTALAVLQIRPQDCLMIGDAHADWDAAQANQVPFLLRRHATNRSVFERYAGESIDDFTDISFSERDS